MFTGIVEEMGTVAAFARAAQGWRLEVTAARVPRGVAIGDSVAVNGCCLTAVAVAPDRLEFDLLEETRRLTNFGLLDPGSPVNLEGSLRANGQIGGHFVTGHIDGLGTIEALEERGADLLMRVAAPLGSGRLLLHKGSIAIDGVSLTVAETSGDALTVWLIPHTRAVTNLGRRRAGDRVNLEFDLLGKYVEKLLASRPA